MSQEASNNKFQSKADEVTVYVDRLIRETNKDLRNFRLEQSDLKSLISSVVNENRQLSGELNEYKRVVSCNNTETLQERHHMTNDALANAMAQIEELKKERENLKNAQKCSERIIKNMEKELNCCRAQLSDTYGDQTSKMYSKSIKVLETRLREQEKEIRSQAKLIKALHEHKQHCEHQIEKLEDQLKKRRDDAAKQDEYLAKVSSLQQQIREMEESLGHTKAQLEDSKRREMVAMRKVQDAILISETAVQEKQEAERQAQSCKEEVNHLSFHIGSIMDEAAKKVDYEVAQLRSKLSAKDKTIAAMQEKMKKNYTEHNQVVKKLELLNNRLSLKYKGVLEQNELLENQMQSCKERLTELEQFAISDENHTLQSKKYKMNMEKYLNGLKMLKSQYKEMLNDLTKRFENAFAALEKENSELIAKNELFMEGADGDGNGKFV